MVGESGLLSRMGASQISKAIFVANDGEERVMLLMNILHREHKISRAVGSVRKAGDRGIAGHPARASAD
ncbi:MAG: hypothetical protein JWO52_5646 [Gammaproteobacteria bacterium]|nr:hypothetical protein [Gammaproteobacteria bacterium]